MKKIYQNPTTELINVKPMSMLASSIEGFEESLDNLTGVDGGDALGREDFDVFDYFDDSDPLKDF